MRDKKADTAKKDLDDDLKEYEERRRQFEARHAE